MKKLFTLLIPILALTAGCATSKPTNTNTAAVVNTINTAVTTNTNTTATNTNTAAAITLHTSVPSGWESEVSIGYPVELHRADPVEGYRESEIVYPNEGYFVAAISTKGTNDFTEYQTLLEQTEKRVDENIFQGTVTSEEPITIGGMQGKRYFFANKIPNNEDDQFFIETILRYDENTIIYMHGQYGAGSDSAQLEADVLAIQNSLTVGK